MKYKSNNSQDIQEYIQRQIGIVRKQKNISQKEVANLVDISAKTLSDIENNRRGISLKTLIKICNVLEIDIIRNFKKRETNG